MKYRILLFVLCLLSTTASTQTLTLTNDGKGKTFKPGGIYEIILADGETDLQSDCCDYLEYWGRLLKVTEDSLHLQLTQYIEREMANDTKIAKGIVSDLGNNYGNIARDDIFSIQYYKSEKSKKRKNAFATIGGILIVTAVATAVNNIFISEKDSRKDLWRSAGVQLGTGIIFGIMASSKKFELKGKDRAWKIK